MRLLQTSPDAIARSTAHGFRAGLLPKVHRSRRSVAQGVTSHWAAGWRPHRALCVVALAICAGCAARWTSRTTQPTAALQWPFAPNKPKLTYLQALAGFSPEVDTGVVLKSFVFGTDAPERDEFVLPVAVATAGDGRIAVADLGRRCVHLYIPAEQRYLRLTGSESQTIASPVGVIFDDDRQLYVSDSAGRVFVFGADGALRFIIQNAGGERLQRPTGITYSPRAKLVYVVDTLAHKVHAFHPNGDAAFSIGDRGEGPGAFNFPTHIFRAPSGELYVTDALNFRIEIFDEQGKALGGFGRHGDGSGDLALPKGVAVDDEGVVYVVDGLFDNVQLFSRDGAFLLTLGQRGVQFGEFWLPAGAFIDASHRLYVCDTYNRRVQIFRIAERYGDGQP